MTNLLRTEQESDNRVYQALTSTLTNKVTERVGEIHRYALRLRSDGNMCGIEAVFPPLLSGIVDVKTSYPGHLIHSLFVDSLEYERSESGVFTGKPLTTSTGEPVYGIGKVYGEILEVWLR